MLRTLFAALIGSVALLAVAPSGVLHLTVNPQSQSGPQTSPTTHPAYVISREYNPTAKYGDGTQYLESYAPTTTLNGWKFMHVHRVRDAPSSGSYGDFQNLCKAGIGFSQGFEETQGNDNVTAVNVAYVEKYLITDQQNIGCYPSRIDPGNEDDNEGPNPHHSDGTGPGDLIDAASPSTHCTSYTVPSSSNPCDVPRWAYFTALEVKAMHDATVDLNADCKTHPGNNCIQTFGASMKNANATTNSACFSNPTGTAANPNINCTNDLLVLDQAWYDLFGNTLYPADIAVQHNILGSGQCAADMLPNDKSQCGLGLDEVDVPYEKETVPGHSPSGGFSGYAPPGETGFVPQNFEPLIGRETMYYAASGDVDNALFTHYAMRDLLVAVNYNIDDLDYDFYADMPDSTDSIAFAQVGWADSLGNLKAGSYAVANMETLLGYGNTGALTQNNTTQFNYTVNGPTNILSYNYEDDNGASFWVALVNNSNEGIPYPNAGQTNLLANQPAPYPTRDGSKPACVHNSGYTINTDNCFNISYQGVHNNFVGFTTVSISNLPSNITHAVVYQNDEYCNNTMTQDSLPRGKPYINYPQGANQNGGSADCYQYWPAGSLQNSIQPSYPTITNHTVSGIKVNGIPTWIHFSSSQLPAIPTMTPLPYASASTPKPSGTIAAPRTTTPLPTPVPQFGPPTGTVPTPPA